jgi:hypothetical protein
MMKLAFVASLVLFLASCIHRRGNGIGTLKEAIYRPDMNCPCYHIVVALDRPNSGDEDMRVDLKAFDSLIGHIGERIEFDYIQIEDTTVCKLPEAVTSIQLKR